MDSVLLDTNVLLDFFEIPRPEHATSVILLNELFQTGTSIYVPATSLKDVYYVLSNRIGEPMARTAISSILDTMLIFPVDENCCRRALTYDEPDFEDGIIRTAAEMARVDYLISRDAHAFVGSLVPRLTPAEVLRELIPHSQ